MNVKSKENVENSAVELVIEVGAEEFEAAVEKVYRKNRNKIAVPGFRKGHAPRKIIEGMYGSSVFYEEAIDELYPTAYAQAVEKEELDPVAYPKVEIVEAGKDGFTFKATVTVKPPYKIGEYKGLPVVREEVSITDEDIENELKPYISRATRLVTVEREAREGDTVLIDFEGFDNGVAFEGGKGENYPLELGSHSFIPGFEEGLVGAKAGDDKELNVTFPEDYTPELAGKPVVFKVKVHEVKEPQAPVVDDEFAKDVSEFDTLDEFKKDLGEKLKERREHAAEHAFEEAVTDALIGVLEVELPEAMVDFRADSILREYAQRFESQGIPFQQYLQMTGQTMDTMRTEAKGAAERQIKTEMALDAVAEAEKLEITEEELAAEYKAMAEQHNMTEEQVKAAADDDDVKEVLLRRKAVRIVEDSVNAEAAPKASAKESAKTETGEGAPKKRASRAKKAEPAEE